VAERVRADSVSFAKLASETGPTVAKLASETGPTVAKLASETEVTVAKLASETGPGFPNGPAFTNGSAYPRLNGDHRDERAGAESLAAATAAVVLSRWNGTNGSRHAAPHHGYPPARGSAPVSPAPHAAAPEPDWRAGLAAAFEAAPQWTEPAPSDWGEPAPSDWAEPAGSRWALLDQPPTPPGPEGVLPQRVPAEPDVPDVPLYPGDPLADPGSAPLADRQELSRIATYLRYDDTEEATKPREGFDVAAILTAVRDVPDVQDAQLRWDARGGHILRLELAETADPGEVSRAVVRLLKERMGLAAEPNGRVGPAVDADRHRGTRLHRPYVTSAGSRPTTTAPRPRGVVVGGSERAVLDHVQVTTLGLEATVEVRLALAGGRYAVATESGPAVDAYLLRLAANAAANAVDQLLIDPVTRQERGRCYVEHAAMVLFGSCEVANVVVLLVCAGVAEQLAGAAIVAGDPRHAIVRATLAALNRRLQALLD
jgi:hypothetical protein